MAYREVVYDTSEGAFVEGIEEAPIEALIPLAESGDQEAKNALYKKLGTTPEQMMKEVLAEMVEEAKKEKKSTEEVE